LFCPTKLRWEVFIFHFGLEKVRTKDAVVGVKIEDEESGDDGAISMTSILETVMLAAQR